MERWQKLIKQYIGIYSFKHIFIYPDYIMRKILLLIICSFICFSSFSSSNVTIDGISYLLEGDMASVRGANTKIVEIPDTIVVDSASYKVYNIGDHAFFNDTIVEHIKLPQTIEKIWDHNFIGCKNLKTIYIQSNLELWNFGLSDYEDYSSNYENYNDEWLYSNCTLIINTNLKGVKLNSTFNKFSDIIYYNGDDDFWIHLGKNIQVKDFTYYIRDEKNVLVSGYSGIGNPTFVNEITLSNHNLNVIGIARNAFEGASIDTLIIPDFIESIGENAFKDCLGLKFIECKGANPPICNQSFGYGLNEAKIYANCELSVPSESFKLYRLMDCWEKFDTKAYDFEMEVIPSTDHATFTWTPTCGAAKLSVDNFRRRNQERHNMCLNL